METNQKDTMDNTPPELVPARGAQNKSVTNGQVNITGWGGDGNSTDDNSWLNLAYGGDSISTAPDTEYRLQRLERGQKITRRGLVVATVPQFKTQSFISQTAANNPFVSNTISTVNIPPGKFPDQVRPNIINSVIRIPHDVTNL